jgi:hypothetical protein
MCDKMVLLREWSKEKTPHDLTPKSIEDMASDALKNNNKIVEMF